jgi:hypothetical protein
MRKMLCSLLVIGFVLAVVVPAQAQVRNELASGRAQLQSDRQAIVAANLTLTEEQAKVFWPKYREYRAELQKLGDGMTELLLDFSKNGANLTDAQATSMLDTYLAIQKNESKIKSAWAPKFRKLLPAPLVTRLYQIDNKLDAIIRYEAADVVPLVDAKK